MTTRHRESSDVSVFSFPDADDDLPKRKRRPSGEQSWANLADAMQVLATPERPVLEPVYRPANLEQLDVSRPVEPPEAESVPLDPLEDSDSEDEADQTPDELDPAGVQKVLDETFQRGIEQGRQEGRDALLQELREQATQQGFAEGEKAGREQGFQQGLQQAESAVTQRVDALAQLYTELRSQRRILDRQQVEQAAILLERLLLEMLRVELKHSPEQIENLVKEAVLMLDTTDRETLKVRLHPDDAEWLQPLVASEQYPIRLLEDRKMTPGGCRIEGSLGDVDATLETRLQEGVGHLRTLLLDDPEPVTSDDLSVVTDAMKSPRTSVVAETIVSSDQPEADQRPPGHAPAASISSFNTANHSSTMATEPEGSSFPFNPDAGVDTALGAWDALGV